MIVSFSWTLVEGVSTDVVRVFVHGLGKCKPTVNLGVGFRTSDDINFVFNLLSTFLWNPASTHKRG
jgi:hypothetical protein